MSGTTLGGKIKSLVISDAPFTSAQLIQKRELVSKYRSFWDKAKFRKGWSKHLFEHHQVEDLLDEAAEIVVRIREALGPQHSKRRAILPTHGNAHEYLWNLESNPLDNKEAFVRDIVHATFSNTAGYLGALSLSVVDDAIAQARAIRSGSQQERIRCQEASRESLLDNWKKAISAMEELFPNNSDPLLLLPPQPQDADQKKHILSKEDRHIRRLLEAFVLINSHLSSLKGVRASEEAAQQQEQTPSSAPEPMKDDEEEKSVPEASQPSDKVDQDQAQDQEKEEPSQGSETEEIKDPLGSSSSESPSEEKKMEDVSDHSDAQEEPRGKDALRHSSACLLRVGKVADGVESLSGHIKEIADQIKALQESSTSSDEEEAATATDPRKELKLIEKLQHQTVGYTDGLMRNLFELDSIVGSESARPKRREQVLRIQNLLKDIDAINSQLHELHQSLKKEAESKASEAPSPSSSSSSVPAPQSPASSQSEVQEAKSTDKETEKTVEDDRALARSSSSSSSSAIATPEKSKEGEEEGKEAEGDELDRLWRKLKLDPQFEVRQDRNAYYVIGMIPGMKREDVDIAIDDKKNTVTIKGFRGPTPKELQIMARQLHEMDRRRAYNRFYPQHENQVLRLLRLGSGRFGSFSETYNIPRDAVPDKIAASYEDGHLIVTIPRVPPPPPKLRPQRDFFNPFFPPQHRDRPYGFFDDEDLFW